MGPPFTPLGTYTRNRKCECIQINVESTRFSNKLNLLQLWAYSQPKKKTRIKMKVIMNMKMRQRAQTRIELSPSRILIELAFGIRSICKFITITRVNG